ncbi:tRNA pseudouridine(55) synthase TruB [Clostridia bacterium]|nr:tRNA pseudouridine(55) synthase TruB [Clostridia bacterium]
MQPSIKPPARTLQLPKPEPLAGFLNLLKPPGMTSNDAVTTLKRALRNREPNLAIGHAGTLDPEAAGVLPIMLGRGTRLFDYLTGKQKEYIAEWVPGVVTDTQDATGRIIKTSQEVPDKHALDEVLARFVGEIEQTPSAYSAIKQDGVPLYERARRGEQVEIQPRLVNIDRLEWLGETERGRMLRVVCGRGVYVRALCEDIGAAVGCAAHMGFLLRSRAGLFSIEDSRTLEEILAVIQKDGPYLKRFRTMLMPLDTPVMDLPKLDAVHPAAEKVLRSGNPLKRLMLSTPDAPEGLYRLYAGRLYVGVAMLDAIEARIALRMIP